MLYLSSATSFPGAGYSFLSKSDMLYFAKFSFHNNHRYSFLSKSDMLYYPPHTFARFFGYSFLSKSDMLYYILNNLLISQQVIPFSKYKTKAIKAAYHLFLPLFLRFQLKFPSRYIVFLLSLTF